MDRHREGRRVNMAASNGGLLSRRRNRSSSSSLRDSPVEGDGQVEFHDTAAGRLRDRGAVGKKDRDRERDRERERERERERDRDRDRMLTMSNSVSRSSKRRRAGEALLVNNHNHHHQHHHLLHHQSGGNHMAVDDSSDEGSINDEEEEEDDDDEEEEEEDDDHPTPPNSVRMLPPNNTTPTSAAFPPPLSSSSFPNHNQNHHHHHHHHLNHQQNHHNYHHRKNFPTQPPTHTPSAPLTATSVTSVAATSSNKVYRSTSATATTMAAPPWKAPNEMNGVSVPRKARSASIKRSHESWASSGGGAVASDQIHRQESTSPLRSSRPGVHGLLPSASASPTTDPVSPSSSNASAKRKMKPSVLKQRPPNSSSSTKSASSTQDEIEIEIAEVLYGMMQQPQGPSVGKQEISSPAGSDSTKFDPREVNRSAGDAKSRASSPTLNSLSASTVPAQSSSLPNTTNSVSSTGVGTGLAPPVSATAPKRKRPRPVKYENENPTVFPVRSSIKVDVDQPSKDETCMPTLENTPAMVPVVMENGEVSSDLTGSQATHLSSQEPQLDQTNMAALDSKPPLTKETEGVDSKPPLIKETEGVDSIAVQAKDEPGSPKKDSLASGVKLDEDRESFKANKGNSSVSEVQTKRGEKFEIDLMAPPPLRSPPERDTEIDCMAVGPKPMVTDAETELKSPLVKEDDKNVLKAGEQNINLDLEVEKTKAMGEVESQKPVVNKERNIDLQLKLEKTEKDSASSCVSGTKLQQHTQKQHQQPPPNSEKSVAAQTNSLPVPMPITGWPGGLPQIGYMAPLPGIVSMEASNLSSAAMQPPHFLSSQQRPKRCATHCYIAKSIHCHQQFTKMNPFWSSAAGSALQYGTKMAILSSTDLHAGRGVNTGQEKGQALTVFPGHSGKDKNSSTVNSMDAAQRKQMLLQQPLPPGASSNILHAPAIIFPLSQQQAVVAASVQPGTGKCPPSTGGVSSSTSSSSASIAAAATATAVAGATGMSFNYPNMAGNETPYLAFLQNGPYTIPIPAHVGTTPAYRGTHPQTIPFFSGSVYSSQMLHPAQIQQQPPPSQSQGQQGHQIPSTSTASTTSQKHLQNQQQQLLVSGVNGGGGNFQGFSSQSNQSLQSMQFQQRQQLQKPCVSHQATKHDGEVGNEDSRVTQLNTNFYGQNFVVPISPPNFTFLNHVPMPGANVVGSNPGDKKQQQQQSQAPIVGVESLPSQAFAMSFASINGATTAPGFDISSFAQNPAIFQSFPEATRHGCHFMAAATAQPQQQKKSYRAPDEGKTGRNDSSKAEDDRKGMAGGKIPAANAQSIAFSRPDNTDAPVTSMVGSSVIESSVRALNYGSSCGQTSGSVYTSAAGNVSSQGVQQQLQRAQQQQMIQLQKHQQHAVPTSGSVRSKAPATSNGIVYSDHVSSPSSVAAKFPNALSGFSQSSVPISSSTVLSPQWKNSAKTTISQSPLSSVASNSSALKNLPQQRSRFQQSPTQISFAASPKSTTTSQGQQPPTSDQSPSSPIVVASPSTSISKNAGGSPRTTATSTGNKSGHSSTFSSQQVKSSTSLPIQKSSPVAGRNVPPLFGNPHVATSSPNSTGKAQLSQQQQQQFSKIALQHSHMIYGVPQVQLHAPHPASSTNAASATSVFGLQRHRSEQQHLQGSSASSSNGMLSLCPPATLSNIDTADPAKASAAALPFTQFAAAQSSGKPHQLVPAGLYVHTVPAAVQLKQAELKQPTGE